GWKRVCRSCGGGGGGGGRCPPTPRGSGAGIWRVRRPPRARAPTGRGWAASGGGLTGGFGARSSLPFGGARAERERAGGGCQRAGTARRGEGGVERAGRRLRAGAGRARLRPGAGGPPGGPAPGRAQGGRGASRRRGRGGGDGPFDTRGAAAALRPTEGRGE